MISASHSFIDHLCWLNRPQSLAGRSKPVGKEPAKQIRINSVEYLLFFSYESLNILSHSEIFIL